MIAGWLAASTQFRIDAAQAFADAGYVRARVEWAGSPTMNEQPRLVAGPAVIPGHQVRYFGIFDSKDARYCLAFFRALPAHTETPNDIAATTMMLHFDLSILHGLNYSALNNCISEAAVIDRGSVLGKASGQTLTAGVRLVCANGSLERPGRIKSKRAAEAVS